MQNLVILGASGSIGQSTLKVLRHNPGRWQVLALTAAGEIIPEGRTNARMANKPEFPVSLD